MMHAGCRMLDVADEKQGAILPMRLLYPSEVEGRVEQFGAYEMNVGIDAPVAGQELPLVVISHGGKGTALTYRGLASHLARCGYVVAMPEHVGDCRADSSLSGKTENLENRPRHIRLAIDASLSNPFVGPRTTPRKIAVIGHSMGGYTALAVAGGQPVAGPHETTDRQPQKVSVEQDPRLRAIVLLAPACAWYGKPGALSSIQVPMLVMTAERDEMQAQLQTGYIDRDCNPGRMERYSVPNAGHHAFQSPFPAAMNRPDFPPARDPAGFDREAFQPVLYGLIHAFLDRHMG